MPRQTLDPAQLQSWRELLPDEDQVWFIRDMIDGFLSESATQLATLHAALQSGDRDACKFLAHRLRGSCSAIGAMQLMDLCGGLETLLAGGDLAEQGDTLSQIQEEYGRVSRALAQERP